MREIFLKLAPLAVVLSILAAMFGGCSSVADTKTVMLDYLKQKYNQEFVPVSYTGPSWAYGYYELAAHPDGKEDEVFLTQGSKNKDGQFICHDNYFGYIIRDDYEEAMNEITKEYFTNFKLYMLYSGGEGMCSDRLNYGTKIEDIYREDEMFFTNLVLFVKQDDIYGESIDNILEKIASNMIKNKLVGQIRLYPTFNNKFNLINRQNIKEVLNKREEWCEASKSIGVSGNLQIIRYKQY